MSREEFRGETMKILVVVIMTVLVTVATVMKKTMIMAMTQKG